MTLRMMRKLQGLCVEGDTEPESQGGGDSYQTVDDGSGEQAAEGPSSAQSEGEVWNEYLGEEEDSRTAPSEEEQGAGEEQDASATSDSEEQQAPAEEEETQEQEQEGAEQESEEAQEEPQEDAQQRYQRERQRVLDSVSEQFKLSDEEVDQMLEDPNSVLPQKMGQMYVDLFEQVTQVMQTNLPQMMEQAQERKAAEKDAEQEFYNDWPSLKGHEDVVERIAATYMQHNPNASREQFKREVGAQAMIAAGVAPEGADQQDRPTPPPAPAGTGGHGGSAGRDQPSGPANEWEELAMDDD